MALEKEEQNIFNEILVWMGNSQRVSKDEVTEKIRKAVIRAGYLKEDWQIDYAVKRIMDEIKQEIKNESRGADSKLTEVKHIDDLLGRGRHFKGKNLLINFLFAFIPAVIPIAILREVGIGGVLIIMPVLFGFAYFIGIIREKIKDRVGLRKSKFAHNIAKKVTIVVIIICIPVSVYLVSCGDTIGGNEILFWFFILVITFATFGLIFGELAYIVSFFLSLLLLKIKNRKNF